jgi:hypothetical protein
MKAVPEAAGTRFMPVNDKGEEVVDVEKRLERLIAFPKAVDTPRCRPDRIARKDAEHPCGSVSARYAFPGHRRQKVFSPFCFRTFTLPMLAKAVIPARPNTACV